MWSVLSCLLTYRVVRQPGLLLLQPPVQDTELLGAEDGRHQAVVTAQAGEL